ncbi:MAG: hypothetical protein JXB32_15925, partial [Deltaproteobacteria bacterium]|nr:hypothetical protein [Deltaproteobacteria bacterium]
SSGGILAVFRAAQRRACPTQAANARCSRRVKPVGVLAPLLLLDQLGRRLAGRRLRRFFQNLLFSDCHDFRSHPVFRLCPLRSHGVPALAPVLVSLNDDDPITFSTASADEHAHVLYALIRRGVPSQNALAWIDQARENAWRSRFTLEISRDDGVLEHVEAPGDARSSA